MILSRIIAFNTSVLSWAFIDDAKEGLSLDSGNNINIVGSDLDAGNKDVNLDAQNDVVIASAKEIKKESQLTFLLNLEIVIILCNSFSLILLLLDIKK